MIELTIIRTNAKQKICGSSTERIAFVINQIRGNIKKMIRDDVVSILFRNTIHQIFPYNQKYYFDYLFNLVFLVFSFRYWLSLNYYPQVFSLVLIASVSKYFIPLSMRQSLEVRYFIVSRGVNNPING